MGLTIVCLLIVAFIVWLFHEEGTSCVAEIMTYSIALFVLWGLVIICSYNTYVRCRAFYDKTNQQYKDAITMYRQTSDVETKKGSLTDSKFDGYQTNMATFIKDLRNKAVWYNKKIICKRKVKESFVFNWWFVGPDDDMKLIDIKIDE